MSTTNASTYTAKLTDGPLEGKTIRTDFTVEGDPQPRLTIPTNSEAKEYLYIRGGSIEFGADDSHSRQPSAVDYRFVQAVFH
ncbi:MULTISPECIES: hypothetical protein [Subtercola]|uniref:Uncharacterized protein n=1 Tax=Subtercola frigoramans TaxID=120298 RepID=A0ABS2L8M0_9MICO|nr:MULTISPECIES: hypothetical protein [Subtercola]MBM7473364.1 hypothetical protein [Subtercola frigoramans]QWT24921.1 hypothetical protein KPL76_06065 [Subtercola sp. PAMC28395]